jgi:hypothetical protein
MCKSSWAIQAAVGKKPALIGNKKLELTYTRGRNYLEIDIDLSSSSIATHILGMVRIIAMISIVAVEVMQPFDMPTEIRNLCDSVFEGVPVTLPLILLSYFLHQLSC